MSPHFIYKFINNPNSNLRSAKGVNIRFEDALQTKRAASYQMTLFLLFLLIEERKFVKKSQQLPRAGRILLQPAMHQHLRVVSNAIKPNVIFVNNFLVSSSTFSKAQTCSKLFSGLRLSFYLVICEKCNLQYANLRCMVYHYRIPKLRTQTL